ncbi:hypothetical protein [Streptomyces sp. NPDC006012]|uniref:hypothetical protein n=1 Tax=Streptomyces sp. NPDC006012 TaxID=3364739 RepID=UPI0036B89B9D
MAGQPTAPGFPALLENTGLPASPLASPEVIEDLDRCALHKLRQALRAHTRRP